jgi:hypothetical protein
MTAQRSPQNPIAAITSSEFSPFSELAESLGDFRYSIASRYVLRCELVFNSSNDTNHPTTRLRTTTNAFFDDPNKEPLQWRMD